MEHEATGSSSDKTRIRLAAIMAYTLVLMISTSAAPASAEDATHGTELAGQGVTDDDASDPTGTGTPVPLPPEGPAILNLINDAAPTFEVLIDPTSEKGDHGPTDEEDAPTEPDDSGGQSPDGNGDQNDGHDADEHQQRSMKPAAGIAAPADPARDTVEERGRHVVDHAFSVAHDTLSDPTLDELADRTRALLGWWTPLVPALEVAEDPTMMGPRAPQSGDAPSAAPSPGASRVGPLVGAGTVLGAGVVAMVATTNSAASLGRLALVVRRIGRSIGALLLFSKLDAGRILDHPLRARIVAALEADPGTTAQALRRAFGIGYGTVVHHVQVLERHGHVTAVREGRHRRLFRQGAIDRRAAAGAALLANPKAARIHAIIGSDPGATQREVAATAGVGTSTVHWHVGRLADAGLVKRRREGRVVRYWPAEAHRTAMMAPREPQTTAAGETAFAATVT